MCEDRGDESPLTLTASPSLGQPPRIHACPYTVSLQYSSPAEADNDANDGDFEFCLLNCDSKTHPSVTADEIFSNGHIRPIYPVLADASVAFREKQKRPQLIQLLMEEPDWPESEVSSSYADESEGISPGTYCLWPPDHSQGSVHKCCPAGSLFGWWARNLFPRRSNSDGKEIIFLAAGKKKKIDAEGGKNKGKCNGKKENKMDLITAHQLYYGQNGRGETRKSSLPYKPEIWGFFHRPV